jgi:flagellar basal-body rod protein FlgB
LLTNSLFKTLERSLDAASLRQSVINNNIANQNTPNFKRSEVRFEQFLKQEMGSGLTIEAKRTNPKHFTFQAAAVREPQVVQDRVSVMNNNSNNVDIDAEMANAAANQLGYGSLVRQVNYEISHLRTAIGGK